MAFDLQALEIETLVRNQSLPHLFIQTLGDEMVGGDVHSFADHCFDRADLACSALAQELSFGVDVLDGLGGEHAQCGSVGGQLIIGIGEVGVGIVFEGQHAV